jgi:transketolase
MKSNLLAKKIRIHALRMTSIGGSSHIASSFSIADILAVLYSRVLKLRPKDPQWESRDRFILSKGHAGAAIYATLAETGFFSIEKLTTHYQNGSNLSGHVSHKGIPGVELSTGSLGHGLGVGCGMAKAIKMAGGSQRVFVLLSDGECDEGSNWEAILFAQHHGLDNLVAIIDYNKIQSLGLVSDTIRLEPFLDKWTAFNWSAIEVDGHNHNLISDAFIQIPFEKGKPTVIIAHTVKGKGVSFMENSVLWHYRCAKDKEFDTALKELES